MIDWPRSKKTYNPYNLFRGKTKVLGLNNSLQIGSGKLR